MLAAVLMAAIAVGPSLSETDFDKPIGFFDTARAAEFGSAVQPLRVLITEAHIPRQSVENFCVVGYQFSSGERLAYVYWARKNRLILWEGGTDAETRARSIARSRRPLDLRRDVVESDADIGGSTYLVTRGWVQRKIDDCAKHGRRYRVSRRQGR